MSWKKGLQDSLTTTCRSSTTKYALQLQHVQKKSKKKISDTVKHPE